MIHYALRCADGHDFDGWFRSSASFDSQAKGGLLECPVCAGTNIGRGLMAPRLSTGAAAPVEAKPPEIRDQKREQMPDQMRAVLQRLRSEIEKNCTYVGPDFAKEVRRMAENSTPTLPVYGEATAEEAASLAEDGIEVARIPWVPRAEG